MKKKKFLLSLIVSIVIVAIIILFLQRLFVPKYATDIKEGAMINEYYDDEKDNDVIFISDCELYENFSPITLWNEYGITSYIRGSAQQLIWQSYYLLEETLKYEKPKAVVFNVLEMIYNSPDDFNDQSQREAYNRMTLDGMKWSISKIKSINASMVKEEREKTGYWGYIFPILRYHDRWKEIKAEDFEYMFKNPKVTDNGYLMQVKVNPVEGEYPRKPVVDYNFGENAYAYLDKITKLCKENDIQLILVKAPSLYPIWYDEYETQIEEYAKENELPYINFLEKIDEIGINWDEDTYDKGLHLNVYGAEKLSKYFGKILSEEIGIENRKSDDKLALIWQNKTKTYEERKLRLEQERDVQE